MSIILSLFFALHPAQASMTIEKIEIQGKPCRHLGDCYVYTPIQGDPIELKIESQKPITVKENGRDIDMLRIQFEGLPESLAPISFKETPLSFPETPYDPEKTKVSDHIKLLSDRHKYAVASYTWTKEIQIGSKRLRPTVYFSATDTLTFDDQWTLMHDTDRHYSDIAVSYSIGQSPKQDLVIHRFVHTQEEKKLSNHYNTKGHYYYEGHHLKAVTLISHRLGQDQWRKANAQDDYRYQSLEHALTYATIVDDIFKGKRGYVKLTPDKIETCHHLVIDAQGAYHMPFQIKAQALLLSVEKGEDQTLSFKKVKGKEKEKENDKGKGKGKGKEKENENEKEKIEFSYIKNIKIPLILGDTSAQGKIREGLYTLSVSVNQDKVTQTWTQQFLPIGSNRIILTGKQKPLQGVDLSAFFSSTWSDSLGKILSYFRPHHANTPFTTKIKADFSSLADSDQITATANLLRLVSDAQNLYQWDVKGLVFDGRTPLNRERIKALEILNLDVGACKVKSVYLDKENLPEQLTFLKDKEVTSLQSMRIADDADLWGHFESVTSLIKQSPELTTLTLVMDAMIRRDSDSVRNFLIALADQEKLTEIVTTKFTFTKKCDDYKKTLGGLSPDRQSALFKKLTGIQCLTYSYDDAWVKLADICENNASTLRVLDFSNAQDGNSTAQERLIKAIGTMTKLHTVDARRIDLWNFGIVKLCKTLATRNTIRDIKMSLPYFRLGTFGEMHCTCYEGMSTGGWGLRTLGIGTGLLALEAWPAMITMEGTYVVMGAARDICVGSQNKTFNDARNFLAGMKHLERLTLHIYNNRKYHEFNRSRVFEERQGDDFSPLTLSFDNEA